MAIIFILTIIILIISISTVTATESNNTTTISVEDNLITQTDTSNTEEIIENTETIDNNIIEENSNTIHINNSNYHDYEGYNFEKNSTILIEDSLDEFVLEIYEDNITITGINNPTLYNSVIIIQGNNNYISNITLKSDDNSEDSQTMIIDGDNNIIENINFNENRNIISRDYYRTINLYGDNNIIRDCTFDATYPSMTINWDSYTEECRSEVIVIHGCNNTIRKNSFNVIESESKEYPYGTIYTLSVYGDENIVDSNEIIMEGTIYLYAMVIYNHYNQIINNIMVVDSIRYANGISLEDRATNNIIRNNTILLFTEPTTIDDSTLIDAAYGIRITEYAYKGGIYSKNRTTSNTMDNIIEANIISGYSSHMYAIELYGGVSTIVKDNEITVGGLSALGVAAVGYDKKILNNKINVEGLTNETQSSPDYLKPQTTGILIIKGANTTISGNNISSTRGTAITIEEEDGVLITENTLEIYDNNVAIDIRSPRGITTIHNNGIKDIDNVIITGGNQSNNYDPTNKNNDQQSGNETTNPNTTNNTTEITDNNATTDQENTQTNNTNTTTQTTDIETNNTEVPEPIEEINNTVVPEPVVEPEENNTAVPELEPENNTSETQKPEKELNNTDVPEPEENKTDVPEPEEEFNSTVLPEPEEEFNSTVLPEPEEEFNSTVLPEPDKEVNNTVVEPEEEINNTVVPEPVVEPEKNSTVVSDPEEEVNNTVVEPEEEINNTVVPEPVVEPEKNNTLVIEPESETNKTITPQPQQEQTQSITSEPQKEQNSTITPNTTNNTNTNKNEGSTRNESSTAGNQPETETQEDIEDTTENTETTEENTKTTEENTEISENTVAVTATLDDSQSKIYEITKKLPDKLLDMSDPSKIILIIIIIISFIYGVKRNNKH